VEAVPGGNLNYNELVVYNNNVVQPSYPVMYESPSSANLKISFLLFQHFSVTYHLFGLPFYFSTLFHFFGYFLGNLFLT